MEGLQVTSIEFFVGLKKTTENLSPEVDLHLYSQTGGCQMIAVLPLASLCCDLMELCCRKVILISWLAFCNTLTHLVFEHCDYVLSLTLREERRLRIFENRVLRRTFGPTKDEVTGEWRRLHNKEIYNLYSSPNIIRLGVLRRLRWTDM
jgi:hypothetical protein